MMNFETALEIVRAAGPAVVTGGVAMAWFKRDPDKEDQEFIEAADLVADTLANADQSGVSNIIHDRNWREDVTIEELENIQAEAKMRRWPFRN